MLHEQTHAGSKNNLTLGTQFRHVQAQHELTEHQKLIKKICKTGADTITNNILKVWHSFSFYFPYIDKGLRPYRPQNRGSFYVILLI
jgi:hypothetical protein